MSKPKGRGRGTPRLTLASPEPLGRPGSVFDWEKCIFCQKDGQLVCPARNPIISKRHAGYDTTATALASLEPLRYELPCGRRLTAIGGPGKESLLNALKENTARWHKECHLKHSGNALARLIKSLSAQSDQETGPQAAAAPAATASTPARRMTTRSGQKIVAAKEDLCFLCGNPGQRGKPLHNCTTGMDMVKRSAILLNDTALIAYLATGNDDLVALEAKYHKLCLARLYNRARLMSSEEGEERNLVTCEGLAFADLLLYMKEKLAQLGNKCVFYVSHLRLAYRDRIAQLLGVDEESVKLEHTSRLRQKILAHYPELHEQQSPHGYMLLPSNADIFNTLDREDQDDDALAVNRFIKKVRQVALESTVSFHGSFPEGCEEASVPPMVLALMNMLMYGSAVHVECRATRPILTLSQLVILGIHKSTPTGSVVRHKKEMEPPLPLYMGLNIFGTSRDKTMISRLHSMGLSVSPNRVMEVTSQLCRLSVARAREEGVVVPEMLERGLFTIAAVDNIDYKPTATTSSGEFHGTGISLFQLPLKGQSRTLRKFKTQYSDVAGKGVRSVPELPDFYAVVPECVLPVVKPPPPKASSNLQTRMTPSLVFTNTWQQEKPWFNQIEQYMSQNESIAEKENLCDLDASWSAFHASRQVESAHEKSLIGLLPLFHENSNSVPMIKHAMDIIKAGVGYLNEDQLPVMCADQPLFALLKSVQWAAPDLYGEKSFVMMLGPLHTEQAFLKVIGKLLEGCGWTVILANSGITTVGEAEGLLKVVDIMKSRAMHQLTAAVLHSLLLDAYAEENPDNEMTFEQWTTERSAADPTFHFWLWVLNLEVVLLLFVKSIRSGDFEMYKESMKSMMPWFFLFKHPHYARWLSVHIHDMENLESYAGSVYRQFQLGNFAIYKTLNPFSALGPDHAHEQNNRDVKGTGAAVGLTQNPAAMRRFTVGGPPLTRLLKEFESHSGGKVKKTGLHHEQYRSFQEKFVAKCVALKDAFLEKENPFATHHSDLISLDTSASAGPEAVEALYGAEENGRAMYMEFVEKLGTSRFYTSIPQSKFQLFSRAPAKVSEVSLLRADCQLFQRLFIICLARDLRLEIFFSYENQLCPPSLSQNGKQRSGVKSHLTDVLEKLVEHQSYPVECAGIIVDGAAMVHNIRPRQGAETFSNYFVQQVRPYLLRLVDNFQSRRLDIVWDTYRRDSLKAATRDSRGSGVRRYNLPLKGKLPPNWEDYLKNDENKSELFPFLGHLLLTEITECSLVTNLGDKIRASSPNTTRLHDISIADLEEADGRIVLHATDMVQMGFNSLLVVSSDTDVVVLCVAFFHRLEQEGLRELFMQYGPSSKSRYIPIHAIARALGKDKAEALLGFHAFTGCDTVEFFASKGKRTAFKAWTEAENASFKMLANPAATPEMIVSAMGQTELYTVHMYGLDNVETVNLARQILFSSRDKPVTLIPPTRAVLEQHALRAAYQAGQIWGRASTASTIPSPDGWGWQLDQEGKKGWEPLWNPKTDVGEDLAELGRCGCTTGCNTRRCKCRRIPLPCTSSCRICMGQCDNKSRKTLEPIMEEAEDPQENPDDCPLRDYSID